MQLIVHRVQLAHRMRDGHAQDTLDAFDLQRREVGHRHSPASNSITSQGGRVGFQTQQNPAGELIRRGRHHHVLRDDVDVAEAPL